MTDGCIVQSIMDKITVKTAELLEKITTNRDAHRALFLKAQEGYRKDVIAELDRMLSDARAGKEICRAINLPVPEDHTDDYDCVITMLKMSTSPIVEVSQSDFKMYVMDDWSWKQHSFATNSFYASKA